MEQEKVVVTGASGFVGSALCAALGHRAVPVLRSPVAVSPATRIIRSIDGRTVWGPVLSGCNSVVHLAARVHAHKDENNANLYEDINVAGTIALARQARDAGVRRFVFVSTAKVHGEGASNPYTDNDPLQPIGAYAKSKARAEIQLAEIGGGMEICILRPPLIYGPGVKANFLSLLRLADKGFPLPLSLINNRRSMIALPNLVSAIITALDNPQARNQAYLVSDQSDISTPQLLRMLGAALRRPAPMFPVPVVILKGLAATVGQSNALEKLIGDFQVDATRFSNCTGWKPVITMSDAVAQVGDWFRRLDR